MDETTTDAPPSADPLTAAELGDFDAEPRLFVADGLVRLSFSSVDTYLNCPAKFRYGYVFRVPTEHVATPLIFGSAVHHALEHFHQGDLARMPDEDALRDWLRDAWETGPFDQLDAQENAELKRRAWRVVTAYRERVASSWRPAAGTEVWFEVPFGPDGGDHEALVVGSIDRLDIDPDGAIHVTDYKTNKKVKSRQRVGTDLQLSIYALAVQHLFGRLPATVALDFVVPGEVVRVPVADLDLDAARQTVIDTARAVREGRFEPTPNPLCDWCDFRSICPAWEGDDGASLGQAEAEIREVRRDVRGLLRLLADKEQALSSLAADVARRSEEQAVVLEAEAEQRRQERARERQAAAEVQARDAANDHAPVPDAASPTLDLDGSASD